MVKKERKDTGYTGKLPPPGGFERRAGEPEGRCPYCSFQPTSYEDFCSAHKPTVR